MDKRQQELIELKAHINSIEKEVTLLLQNLQWDPKVTVEKRPMVACKYDANHRIPMDGTDTHEEQCNLTKQGYRKDDTFLPDPVDPVAATLVKFSTHEIAGIFNNAAIDNPLFKRGLGCQGPEPLTVERLQRVYTADERRALHDAAVSEASFCHDLADLDLLSSNDGAKESQKKSRLDILAELRNMKRRRTKYRVAPKTRNYSDVLRDVIKTQMDSYGEARRTIIETDYDQNVHVSQKVSNTSSETVLPHGVVIKLERKSPEAHSHHRYQREGPSRENYGARSRERKYIDVRREFRKDCVSFKDKDKNYEENQQSESEKKRDKRYDNYTRKHHKDKYLHSERSKDYHQREHIRDRSQDGKNYDKIHSDYPSRTSKNYENYRKEKELKQESEYDTDYTRESSRDGRHHNSKKYHSNKERSEKHCKRTNPDVVIKQERESPPDDSYSNGDTSRKHHRSTSKERRHKNKKRKSDKEKHSLKRDKKRKSSKRKHDYSPQVAIKQEQQSP